MKMTNALPFLVLLVLVSSCSTASIGVTEVLNHGTCSGLDSGVYQVTLEEVARLRGSRMFGSTSTPADKSSDTLRLVAVSRGQQPTAGYALELISAIAITEKDIEVTLRWHQPAVDAVVAQVVTQPCLVLGLPDAASGTVSVKLEDGTPLGSLPALP